MSMDGVYYFVKILEEKEFYHVSWARYFAELIIQWPLVVAVNIGMKDLSGLAFVHGMGMLIVHAVSFALCWRVLADKKKWMMVFPIASYLMITQTGDYWFLGEHHVMTLMSWPILFLLLKSEKLEFIDSVILLVLLVGYLRLYETAAAPAAIFLILALRSLNLSGSLIRRVFNWTVLALVLGAIVIAVFFIIEPRSAIQKGAFLDSVLRNLKIKEVVFLSVALIVISMMWIPELLGARLTATAETRARAVGLAGVALIVTSYCYERISGDYAITAYWSFSSRALSGVVLPLLLGVATIVYYKGGNARSSFIVGFSLIFLVFFGANTIDLANWREFRKEFSLILEEENDSVFLDISATSLNDNHSRWSWNNGLLSLVWAGSCVDRIIYSADEGMWAYNPEEEVLLTHFLFYDERFLEISPKVITCQ